MFASTTVVYMFLQQEAFDFVCASLSTLSVMQQPALPPKDLARVKKLML